MQLNKSKFHFVGIGGIGMCGLAELLHNMGAQVTGSDMSENANVERLKKIGVQVFLGHNESHVGNCDVVVYSSAIPQDNPEIRKARALDIPLIPRAEALAEIMRLKRGLAVAGTHGKTTTTSMTAAIFLKAETQPTVVVGGKLNLIKSTALLGRGDWLIAEADESDNSFQKLSPEIAIITNIDNDHLDYFKSFEQLQKAFVSFAQRVPFYGSCVVYGDDPAIRELFKDFPKRLFFYGFKEDNDFCIQGSNGHYTFYRSQNWKKIEMGQFDVKVPGIHNALNATAAIIAGMRAGFSFEMCRNGIADFQGVDRRFQLRLEHKDVLFYDDYGHHPTEVKATLQAVKEKYPKQRLVVLFQPHRYSRTQNSWHEFLTCFTQADQLFITDVYAAGESPLATITGERLAQEIKHDRSQFISKSRWPELAQHLKPGDVFMTMGAGDVWKASSSIAEMMK